MGAKSHRKGYENERQLALILGGLRVPLSGAQDGYPGDVIDSEGWRWEAKVRSHGFKQLYGWLADNDALAVRADRKEWLVVMPLRMLLEMRTKIKEQEKFIEDAYP